MGYHRVPGPTAARPPRAHPGAVVMVLVDGLRPQVLDAYMRVLREAEYAPDWRSGLALLGEAGFHFASSGRAETVAPGAELAAAASLVTGAYPDETGLPGTAFYEAGRDGTLLRYDFGQAAGAAQIYFASGFAYPDEAGRRPLASRLLRRPTLFERLAPTHRSTVVFGLFGAGAEWLVPRSPDAGVSAIMRNRVGASAAPVFDRGARDGAIAVLTAPSPPDLTVITFRDVLVNSCTQDDARCDDVPDDLPTLQRRALRTIDGHLWRIFDRYRRAHPAALAETTVILLSTVGVADRGGRHGEHLLRSDGIIEGLARHATAPCRAWLSEAWAEGRLSLAANDGAAHLYLARATPGRGARLAVGRACLAAAVQDTLKTSPWLAGAAWALRPHDATRGPIEVALRPAFGETLAASRRARLTARMGRIFDTDEPRRAGDVVLFATSPWVFLDAFDHRPAPYAHTGGLEAAATQIPFLVASRHLSETAARKLAPTPVELTDVAPTLLSLLDAPEAAFQGLERPPLLGWREQDGARRLVVQRADRQIAPHGTADSPRLALQTREGEARLTFSEPVRLWPPASVSLRLGPNVYRFEDGVGFLADAPCHFSEGAGRREWACAEALPTVGSAPQIVAASRDPAEGTVPPMILLSQDGAPAFSVAPRVICVGPQSVRVALVAADPVGLARAELVVADAHGAGLPGRVEGATRATRVLGGLSVDRVGCAAPLSAACTVAPTRHSVDEVVTLPFPAGWLAHHRRAQEMFGRTAGITAAVRARLEHTGVALEGRPAERSYLALRLCNVAGTCAQRPLLTDAEHSRLLEIGCP